ncbi:hypothetical protein Pla108_02000 [Botrimarina colliarenosi]|uniref:Uncharacterized protein n=1 Tax=Botrimarina colliarenosi TaxID=2528001 RepID=A0A5C6AJC3_9BACT|nr:hypothetical protein Pla108_02000 [Botrimarina colliarenosi]
MKKAHRPREDGGLRLMSRQSCRVSKDAINSAATNSVAAATLGGVLGLNASEQTATLGLAAGVARVANGLAARSGFFAARSGSGSGFFAARSGLNNRLARGGLAADGGLFANRLAARSGGLAAALLVAAEQAGFGLNASRQNHRHRNSKCKNVLHLYFSQLSGFASEPLPGQGLHQGDPHADGSKRDKGGVLPVG